MTLDWGCFQVHMSKNAANQCPVSLVSPVVIPCWLSAWPELFKNHPSTHGRKWDLKLCVYKSPLTYNISLYSNSTVTEYNRSQISKYICTCLKIIWTKWANTLMCFTIHMHYIHNKCSVSPNSSLWTIQLVKTHSNCTTHLSNNSLLRVFYPYNRYKNIEPQN